MTTPKLPPMEPLDAEEREFARILHALPGGEPPPALDAKILRAATNAVAAQRRPGARFVASAGALWGIGSAAAAVLALGVAWQMRYGAPDGVVTEASAPRAQAVSDVADDEAVPVQFGSPAAAPAMEAAPPPPNQPQRRLPEATLANKPLPVQVAPPAPPAAPEPYPADHLDEHVAREAAANAAAEVQALDSAQAMRSEEKERDDQRDRAAAKSSAAPPPATAASSGYRDQSAAGADAGALGGLARQDAAPMKPAPWLAEIRRLRDAGEIDAARARLVEFRRAYPKWVIPTDLAPLLSE